MEGAPQIGRPSRGVFWGWGVFLIVVALATWLAGPLALMILAIVGGLALIVTGTRSAGWPRPVLIVVGAMIALAPLLVYIDFAFGHWVVTVQ